MSRCEYYQELISRMLDGDLSVREDRALREHIRGCAECAALYKAFSAISGRIRDDLEEVPFDLRENVMAEIRRENIRRKNRLPAALRGVLAAAACVAILVGIGLGVSPQLRGQLSATAFGGAMSAEKSEDRALMNRAEAAEAVCEEAVDEALPMEEPACESVPEDAFLVQSPAAAPETAAQPDAAGGEVKPAPEEWDLSSWELATLREFLGGTPANRSLQELEPLRIALLRVRSGDQLVEVPVFAEEEALYFYDPLEDAVFLSDLSPAEFLAFLGR